MLFYHQTNNLGAIKALAMGDTLTSAMCCPELNTGAYSADLPLREEFEKTLFGGHPVYACVGTCEFKYGEYTIAINPDTVVSTGTQEDSLELYMYCDIKYVRSCIVADPRDFHGWEVQIHSPVTAACVDHIDMSGYELEMEIVEALEAVGVEVRNWWLPGCSPRSCRHRWGERLKAEQAA